MKKLFSIVVIIFLHGFIFGQGGGFTWTSSDESTFTVTLGEGSEFKYTNPDGTSIYLKAGPGGASMTYADHKDKSGSIWVTLGKEVGALDWIANAMDPNYGMNGEPPMLFEGFITGGTGTFDVELIGFEGIDDVVLTFTAVLVSDGNDNPLTASVYGQGDQLAFPNPGTLSFTTKWHSDDDLLLSNGEVLIPGDFYLNSYAEPSNFSYSISLPDISSNFTIGESYLFVYDLTQPPTGENLRFQLDGSVSKDLMGTFMDTIPTLTEWGVIILLLLVLGIGVVFLYQRQATLAMAGASNVSNPKPKLFDGKLFFKIFAIVLLLGIVGLVAAFLYYGQINIADPFGTVVSAGIVAYIAHLWLLRK